MCKMLIRVRKTKALPELPKVSNDNPFPLTLPAAFTNFSGGNIKHSGYQ